MTDENPLLSEDPRAWDRLIDSVGPASLLWFIESRLGESLRREVSAEDVWQEALLHAWRDRAQCEWHGLAAFRRWLLGVIDHRIGVLATRAATLKRGGGNAPAPFSALGETPAIPASTTPSRAAIHREEARAIHAALAELPDELRDVVRLRLLEEQEMEAVAAALGLGISACYHRFRKGIALYERRLRAELGRSRDEGSRS